jgi:hypothetical protein
MRVRFEMSGGYGGLFAAEPLEVDVDSSTLPEKERAAFVEMVRVAMASDAVGAEQGEVMPDLMTYKLRIVDEGAAEDAPTWEAVVDDRTVPDEMVPLIDYMRTAALRRRAEQQ